MSLTNRLLVFLLSLLAAVLLGFSVSVFMLVYHYLRVERDERLAFALNTLVGSIDIEEDNVEWEPADRTIALPHGPLGEEIYWFITDIDGHLIDAVSAPESNAFQQQIAASLGQLPITTNITKRDARWHYQQRAIKASHVSNEQLHRERTQEEIEKEEYPALIIVAGISQLPMRTATQQLILVLTTVGLLLWSLCFAVGRMICRRALIPVSRMANAAQAMSSRDLSHRLPSVPPGDELATMNEAFNQLLDRLEVAFERQRRFTSDASHQLRTPLTIIQGQAEVALRRVRSAEDYQEVLQTIRLQVGRLNALVESLLFLARADSVSALPKLQPTDLVAWLSDFERTWKPLSEDAKVHFEVSAIPSLLASAHTDMLNEIARNLLDNAIKYSPPGAPVTIGLIHDEKRAGFRIFDNGRGISKDEISHVFQPFFRAESAQQSGVKGSGLGLSIAYRLCRAMNGTIEVESQLNRGSTFSTWLNRC